MSTHPISSINPGSTNSLLDPSQIMKKIQNLDENFIALMVFFFIVFLVIGMIGYIFYISSLEASECTFMNNLYGKLNKHLHSIRSSNPDFSGNFNDYYVKTAYNACSGGSYKNDFVNICNLKSVLKQGVRGLDFEIYSLGDRPVVATSTIDNFYVKETFNSVDFSDVMETLKNYAFSSSTAPNPSDPIIIHLRIMSNNQPMFKSLAKVFKSYENLLLGKDYSYENYGMNLGRTPILQLLGKIIIIVDRKQTSFLQNKKLMEFVNMTSNSIFMRALNYYDVQYSPDISELQNYNKTNMTIVLPDKGANPTNPNPVVCRETGCQMIAMRFQRVDNYLESMVEFFDKYGYAFQLKPVNLRYQPVTIPDPTPQNPALSYQTRTVSTDYYSFNV
jgi:hypothetical protein